MSKKNIVIRDIAKLPAAIRKFWGPPPLLPSENEEAYWNFAAAITHSIGPVDPIMLVLVKDVVDYSWEIRQLRGFKSKLVVLKQNQHTHLADAKNVSPREKKANEQYFASPVGEADLFLDCISSFEAINDLIGEAERRRLVALSQLESYRKALAARLREASDNAIIEGECAEPDPVPAGGGHDRTAQDDPIRRDVE